MVSTIMQEVTDPKILSQLNGSDQQSPQAAPQLKEVTDPALLSQLNSGQSASPQPAQPQINSTDSNILAKVAGLANGGADVGQAIADTPTYIMQHLHIISPETANKLYKASKENADMFRSSSAGDQSDIFNKAVNDNPTTAGLSKLGVDTAGVMESMRPIGMIGAAAKAATGDALIPGLSSLPAEGQQIARSFAPLRSAASTMAGVGARAAAMGTVGQATADPQNKDAAFALNTALSPAADAAGALISKLGTKAQTAKDITNEIGKAGENVGGLTTNERAGAGLANMWNQTKAVMDKWYNVVKSMPWSSRDQASAYGLASRVHDFIDTNGSSISRPQLRLLNDFADQLGQAGSHGDLLKTVQNMGGKYGQFSGLKSTDPVYKFFGDLKGDVKGIIQDAAQQNNVEGALHRANTINERMIQPMKDVGADQISELVQKYGQGSDEVRIGTDKLIETHLSSPGKLQELVNAGDNTVQPIIRQHIVSGIFNKIAENPSEFDYGKASDLLGTYINRFEPVLAPPEITAMKGIQRIMKTAGTALKSGSNVGTYVSHRVGAEGGAMAITGMVGGGYAGYQQGGGVGALIGSTVGLLAGPAILHGLQDLVASPNGQEFLASLANPGIKMNNLKEVVKSLSVMGLTKTINSNKSQQAGQQ